MRRGVGDNGSGEDGSVLGKRLQLQLMKQQGAGGSINLRSAAPADQKPMRSKQSAAKHQSRKHARARGSVLGVLLDHAEVSVHAHTHCRIKRDLEGTRFGYIVQGGGEHII